MKALIAVGLLIAAAPLSICLAGNEQEDAPGGDAHQNFKSTPLYSVPFSTDSPGVGTLTIHITRPSILETFSVFCYGQPAYITVSPDAGPLGVDGATVSGNFSGLFARPLIYINLDKVATAANTPDTYTAPSIHMGIPVTSTLILTFTSSAIPLVTCIGNAVFRAL